MYAHKNRRHDRSQIASARLEIRQSLRTDFCVQGCYSSIDIFLCIVVYLCIFVYLCCQDFLNYQSEHIRPLYANVSFGQQWLQQMGEAASRYGIQLQYCMALPRHLLATLQIPAVSQVSKSPDPRCITGQ